MDHRVRVNANLLLGARFGRLEVVERALAQGADVNTSDAFGLSAMHFAAQANDARLVHILVCHDASIHHAYGIGLSPFFSAAVHGRLDSMKLLAHYSLDLDYSLNSADGLLENLLDAGSHQIAEWLIDQGADTECNDARGSRLITRMIEARNDSAAILLLQSGVYLDHGQLSFVGKMGLDKLMPFTFDSTNNSENSSDRKSSRATKQTNFLFDDAVDNGLLLDMENHIEKENTDTEVSFFTVWKKSYLKKNKIICRSLGGVQKYLGRLQKFSVHMIRSINFERHLCKLEPSLTSRFISLLMQKRVDEAYVFISENIDFVDLNEISTPRYNVLQSLVSLASSNDISTDSLSSDKRSASPHDALLNIFKIVNSKNVDRKIIFSRYSNSGNTILHELIDNGHIFLVVQLLQLQMIKSMINFSNFALSRPVHLAVSCNSPALISALVAAGANINAYDRDGNTPLHLGLLTNNQLCSEQIIESGANVYLKTRNGISIEQLLMKFKGEKQNLSDMIYARKAADMSKSIFSFNNPMAQIVKGQLPSSLI